MEPGARLRTRRRCGPLNLATYSSAPTRRGEAPTGLPRSSRSRLLFLPRPPKKRATHRRPPGFASREAWLLWCERDRQSEAQELAMDELMNSARAA
jgi:hypothetical protein